MKHQYSGFGILINSYYHKGYWYYGSRREKNTVEKFYEIIKKGVYVFEIGGHKGYLSTLFSSIIGPDGKLDVSSQVRRI